MSENEDLARRFEHARDHLRAVAFRLLGSSADAEDVVQQAWLRLAGADAATIRNLEGWLTTTVGRLSLDLLRSRRRVVHRADAPERTADPSGDPETEAVLAAEVGRALLVVLDRLSPRERVAFVLHDAFGVPFDDIASIVGRTPTATKQLASRARRRIHGEPTTASEHLSGDRRVVVAFLEATRAGDVNRVAQLLAPGVIRRADASAVSAGTPAELHGAEQVAEETRRFAHAVSVAEVALVDGAPGIVVAPRGRLEVVLQAQVTGGRITEIRVVSDPRLIERLAITLPPPV